MRIWTKAILAAAFSTLALSGAARAAALLDLQVEGSTTGAPGSYSTSLSNLTPGEVVYVEVTGQLAPVGTVNGSNTITSETSADGISSLSLNVADSDSSVFSNPALGTPATGANVDWTGGSGESAGTASGNGVSGIRPTINGVDGAVNGSPDLIWLGQLTLGSAASETVSSSWDGTSGGFKINGGTKSIVVLNATSAASLVSFAPLSLSETQSSPVPAPSILGACTLVAGLGLVKLARRRQIA